MKVVVVANDDLKAELLQQGVKESLHIEWSTDINSIDKTDATVCIDLLFTLNPAERIEILKRFRGQPVIVNDVTGTTENLPVTFVRINGWPTLLKRPVVEAATAGGEKIKNDTTEIFSSLNKRIEWTADVPGFITARIISMIINEAYFALEQQVSSPEEIDIAMKMGTNYPYGPFEWCHLIGKKNVYSLLKELYKIDARYEPCNLLKQQTTF